MGKKIFIISKLLKTLVILAVLVNLVPQSLSQQDFIIKDEMTLADFRATPSLITDSISIRPESRSEKFQYTAEFTFYVPENALPDVEKVCIMNLTIKTPIAGGTWYSITIDLLLNNYAVPTFYPEKLKKSEVYQQCPKINEMLVYRFYTIPSPICFDKGAIKAGENKLTIKMNIGVCELNYLCLETSSGRIEGYKCGLESVPIEIDASSIKLVMYKPKIEAYTNVSSNKVGYYNKFNYVLKLINNRNITAYDIVVSISIPPDFEIVSGSTSYRIEKLGFGEETEVPLILRARKVANYTNLGQATITWKDKAGNTYKTVVQGVKLEVLPPKLEVEVIPQQTGEQKVFTIYVKDYYSKEPLPEMEIKIIEPGTTTTLTTDIEGKAIYTPSIKSGEVIAIVSGKGYPATNVTFKVQESKPVTTEKPPEQTSTQIPILYIIIGVAAVIVVILLIVLLRR